MDKSLYTRQYKVLLTLLREARTSAGVSQVQLAEHLGMTQSAVSKCELGATRLDLIQLRSWAELLGVGLPALVNQFEERLAADIVASGSDRAKERRSRSGQ